MLKVSKLDCVVFCEFISISSWLVIANQEEFKSDMKDRLYYTDQGITYTVYAIDVSGFAHDLRDLVTQDIRN